MQPGLVSTIIPVFNRPKMLRDAVSSVINQTYRPIEIVIINDGSTDSTPDVIAKLAKEHQEIITAEITNSGPGAARQAGMQLANGEFIQYLDSDDLLMPTKFEKQVAGMQTSPNAGVSYCRTSIELVSENKIVRSWKRTGEQIDAILPSMLAGRWWGTSTPLYRRTVCDSAGSWQAWINEEDWEYDCRIGLHNGSLNYIPEELSLQRQHGSPRLSSDGDKDPKKLAARQKAHLAIISHAIHAKVTRTPEFIHLLKGSFLLSRQCAAAGLAKQSKELFIVASGHLKHAGINVFQLRTYRLGASLIGWRNMGKISAFLDRLRS